MNVEFGGYVEEKEREEKEVEEKEEEEYSI